MQVLSVISTNETCLEQIISHTTINNLHLIFIQ